jgi:flagellar biosynthesis/type III secretory pathway protein FliH
MIISQVSNGGPRGILRVAMQQTPEIQQLFDEYLAIISNKGRESGEARDFREKHVENQKLTKLITSIHKTLEKIENQMIEIMDDE